MDTDILDDLSARLDKAEIEINRQDSIIAMQAKKIYWHWFGAFGLLVLAVILILRPCGG